MVENQVKSLDERSSESLVGLWAKHLSAVENAQESGLQHDESGKVSADDLINHAAVDVG